MSELPAANVERYHQRTKHRLDGYAAGPDTLDWDDQPDPFRRFDGAELIALPLGADQLSVPFSQLSVLPKPGSKERDVPELEVQAATLQSVAILLELSVALSAWKQYGTARWSLRVNPSSGNLHPTEAYVIAQGIHRLDDGVYHYRADRHALERRCRFVAAGSEPTPLLLIGLSSVYWREAWKYGERAYRYCQHDVGHASAALGYAAATLGWQIQPNYHIGDATLSVLLGLNRDVDFGDAEREHPDLLLSVNAPGTDMPPDAGALRARCEQGDWFGQANVLDTHHHYSWPIIDEISAACCKPDLPAQPYLLERDKALDGGEVLPTLCSEPASKLFRRRRSAQAFDGSTMMGWKDFMRCLDQLQPRAGLPPWGVIPWQPKIHLILFVHRVEGIAPGLYALPRSEHGQQIMRAEMREQFQWLLHPDLADSISLYQLMLARSERTIAKLSCQQAIAGDSCFSVAMLAEFDAALAQAPWCYRELFWEAGALGQILYLEAEAAGLRGTGIGCYFDDAVHELLGLAGTTLQSMYHFTVGGPLVDPRITTLPPYSLHHR